MPTQRLRSGRDIRAVFAARAARRGAVATVHTRTRGDDGPARVTVVAGRKLGGAVTRNRAKRRLRAALAEVRVPNGTDVVVVAREASLTAPFDRLRAELASLLATERAGAGREARR